MKHAKIELEELRSLIFLKKRKKDDMFKSCYDPVDMIKLNAEIKELEAREQVLIIKIEKNEE